MLAANSRAHVDCVSRVLKNAERLPQAAALPWLASGQAVPVEGRWLVCLPCGPDPAAAPPGTAVYTRLQVG